MGKPEKKTKPPLPAWGQVASNAFWLTLGFRVVLVLDRNARAEHEQGSS